MPNSPNAKKRLRQNIAQRAHNRSIRATVRTQIRRVEDAIKAGDVEETQAQYRLAQKKLDKIGAKNLFHPNKVARIKSRLVANIKKMQAGEEA
ncbi:30S ribosomal protein S20 [Planctomycetales bacterium 10988]|nr:30S ribosomal protein S20 [Planctomycetales bacterium 10988]